MRTFYLALFITSILFQCCKGQTTIPAKEFYNKDFNWKIVIPAGYDSVSAADWNKMQNKGADAIQKTYDVKVDTKPKTIFVFKSDQFNYFESNYQPFDSSEVKTYMESYRAVNNMLYGTFKAQMPDSKLDSSSSEETIDGRLFHTFKVAVAFPNKMVMEIWMFSRLFGNKEFTVDIMTVDKNKQKALLDAWRNSTFGNE